MAVSTVVPAAVSYVTQSTCDFAEISGSAHITTRPKLNPSSQQQNGADGMCPLMEGFRRQGLSGTTQNILLASWWKSTKNNMTQFLKEFCGRKQIDKSKPTIENVLSFFNIAFWEK